MILDNTSLEITEDRLRRAPPLGNIYSGLPLINGSIQRTILDYVVVRYTVIDFIYIFKSNEVKLFQLWYDQ